MQSKLNNFISAIKSVLPSNGGDSSFGLGVVNNTINLAPKLNTKNLINAYNELPWFRAILSKVSKSTSTVEWKVFAQRKSGKAVKNTRIQKAPMLDRQKMIKKGLKDGSIEEIESHPVLDVLKNGNPLLRGPSNLQVSQLHIDSVGESFILKERGEFNSVSQLWPIPPTWIKSTPNLTNPLFEFSHGALKEEIPMTEIIWIKDVDPVNPYARGSGIGAAIADELGTDDYASKHTKNWFFNSARPDLIISGTGLNKAETKRLETDWLNKTQGFLKKFKPYFMNAKVDVKLLTQNFKEMQLIELRQFERDLFIQVFGIPPEMIGLVENSNRATIDSADYIFSKFVIVPRLEMQRAIFQVDLIPDFDDRIILDYVSPVSDDKDYKLNVMKTAPWAWTANEWRELAGYEDIGERGEFHGVPFNLNFVKSLSEGFDLDKSLSEGFDGNTFDYRHKSKNKTLTTENEGIVNQVLRSLDSSILVSALVPQIRNIISSFGETMSESISDIPFSIEDPKINEFINSQSTSRIRTFIDGTTRKKLRATLIEGLSISENIDDLSDRVNLVFDAAGKNRSRVIARTETVRAANFGSLEGMRQSGVPMKQWLSSRDSVTRDSHAIGSGLDGQTVLLNANFKSPITGSEGPHPGDLGLASEDVNCRCASVPVFDESDTRTLSLSEESKVKIWKAFDNQRLPFEKKMRRSLAKAFDQQRKSVLDALRSQQL